MVYSLILSNISYLVSSCSFLFLFVGWFQCWYFLFVLLLVSAYLILSCSRIWIFLLLLQVEEQVIIHPVCCFLLQLQFLLWWTLYTLYVNGHDLFDLNRCHHHRFLLSFLIHSLFICSSSIVDIVDWCFYFFFGGEYYEICCEYGIPMLLYLQYRYLLPMDLVPSFFFFGTVCIRAISYFQFSIRSVVVVVVVAVDDTVYYLLQSSFRHSVLHFVSTCCWYIKHFFFFSIYNCATTSAIRVVYLPYQNTFNVVPFIYCFCGSSCSCCFCCCWIVANDVCILLVACVRRPPAILLHTYHHHYCTTFPFMSSSSSLHNFSLHEYCSTSPWNISISMISIQTCIVCEWTTIKGLLQLLLFIVHCRYWLSQFPFIIGISLLFSLSLSLSLSLSSIIASNVSLSLSFMSVASILLFILIVWWIQFVVTLQYCLVIYLLPPTFMFHSSLPLFQVSPFMLLLVLVFLQQLLLLYIQSVVDVEYIYYFVLNIISVAGITVISQMIYITYVCICMYVLAKLAKLSDR